MKKIVVYTSITGGVDRLKPVPDNWRDEADFVAFLDRPQEPQGWEVRPAYAKFSDPCRNAKVHKILPHFFFPDAEYSVWVDGSIGFKSHCSLQQLISQSLQSSDLAVFPHRTRSCIYVEADRCSELAKDSPEEIQGQISRYRSEGFPEQAGLAECCVLIRRHCKTIAEFNEAWHHEILLHSRRDQLSFLYAAQRVGLEHAWLTGSIARNEHFVRMPHERLNLFRQVDSLEPTYTSSGREFFLNNRTSSAA